MRHASNDPVQCHVNCNMLSIVSGQVAIWTNNIIFSHPFNGLQLAKNEKVDSLYAPVIKFIGKMQMQFRENLIFCQ